MKSLPNEIIEEIIRNQNLRLKEEDSLMEFILSLYENDSSCSNLFEYVLFCNVNEETLEKFVNEFHADQINNQIFHSICKRFFMDKNKNENELNKTRYSCPNRTKLFKPNEKEDFNGILRYLTNKTGGNIHDNGTIEISSNSIYSSSFLPQNSVDYQNNNIYHSKSSKKDVYIRYDFKDRSIQASAYSIQSASGNTIHLKNWVIEVSEDGQKWQEIDHRTNNSELNGFNNKSRFDVNNPQNKFYRYIQLRQTGEGWYDWIGFAFFEIYGKLQEC